MRQYRTKETQQLHTNGPEVIKPKKDMLYPREKMGKEETNTNVRYEEYR